MFEKFEALGYVIHKDGRITTRFGRTLSQKPNSIGYVQNNLGGEMVLAHRMVAEKFVPNPLNLPVVNHIDEVRHNNDASNLEWTTYRGNMYHRHARLRNDQAHQKSVSCSSGESFLSIDDAAKAFNIARTSISNALHGRSQSAGGVKWRLLCHSIC